MAYYDDKHSDRMIQFNGMWAKLDDIEKLALEYGINDIAQDNNLKLLQTLVLFDFDNQPAVKALMLLIGMGMIGNLKPSTSI